MIDLVDLPEGLEFHFQEGRKVLAFEGTFDIYDMAIGIALYTDPLEAASGLWMTPQTDAENPVQPDEEAKQFFLEGLIGAFGPDGSFGMPVYSFMTDGKDAEEQPTAES